MRAPYFYPDNPVRNVLGPKRHGRGYKPHPAAETVLKKINKLSLT